MPEKNNITQNNQLAKKIEAGIYFSNSMDVIINATKIGLWDWHLPSGKVIYSKQWEHIAGYEEGELEQVVETWENAVLPEDLEMANRKISQYLEGKTDKYEAEFRMVRKDGSIIWAQDKGNITEWDENGKPVRLVGVLQDVSSIKLAEEQLKQKTEQLDFVANMAGLASWDWDVTSGSITYSDDYLKMMGYDKSEINGTLEEWESFNHPDDLPNANKALEDFINGNTDTYSQEIRMRHKDGRYIWTLDTGRIIKKDKNGKALRILGGHLNIDKLKHTEEELQEMLLEKEKYNEKLQVEIQNAINNLKESQLLNKSMFEADPYVSMIFDNNFKIIDCNPAAIKYFGFSDKEDFLKNIINLINKSIPEYQPGGMPSISFIDRFKHTVENGYNDFETELIFNGERIPMQVTMKKIPYKDSFAIVLYQIDLRSLKEAKNELLRQDRLLKAVNDVAYLLMGMQLNDDEFYSVVKKVLRILGESVNADRAYIWKNSIENTRLCCSQVVEWARNNPSSHNNRPPVFIPYEEFVPNLEELLGKSETINSFVKNLDKTTIAFPGMADVLALMVIPIFLHGNFWGFIGFDRCTNEQLFTDTEQNIMKSAGLLISSAILRNETTQNLILAKEEALASTKAKSDFLSRMSHEIRTPMNAIIGMTNIAEKTKDLSKIEYCLNKIDNASQQLLGIINDILDMSKIEANKFEIIFKEFNFEKMLENIFNIMSVKIEEKQQNFKFIFEDIFTHKIIGDEMRLSQVFINLLSNAVKFTPEGGNISLTIKQIPKEKNRSILHVEIKDNGIGITPEQQYRLFNSFEQADGTITRKYGGTGLGLAICKKVISLMDGKIWVESEFGKGSSFIFEVEIEWGDKLLDKKLNKKAQQDLKILVVDDNEDVLFYFKDILNNFSMDCDIASGGHEAIKKVKESVKNSTPYDLIFLDWRMPVINGAETAKEIKKIADNRTIVIMISVADWSEIENEVKSIGITQFLPKPVLPSVLYNTIVELIDHSFMPESRLSDIKECNWANKEILVVEDIEINREIIFSILENSGALIDFAINGLQAIEMFKNKNNKYDIILMDVQMPMLDGLDATRQIRNSGFENSKKIPIIAMTANAFKEDIDACLEAGMNDHVAKPIDLDILIDKLSFYLANR